MASGFTLAAKRSRTAGEAPLVRKQGKEHNIPWDDICPVTIREWLDTFSKANNTTSDILLASVLPTVACLMLPSTTKVHCRIRAENVNLYMICYVIRGREVSSLSAWLCSANTVACRGKRGQPFVC